MNYKSKTAHASLNEYTGISFGKTTVSKFVHNAVGEKARNNSPSIERVFVSKLFERRCVQKIPEFNADETVVRTVDTVITLRS